MPRISLSIHRTPHAPAAQIGYSLSAIRLLAHVSFKDPAGWSSYRQGVVDTGAAASLLPADVWHSIEYRAIGTTRIGGINARDESRIPARLAIVTCGLSDGASIIGPLQIHAYLADSNEVPLLLGICDLIENGALHAAIKQGNATFEG